MIRIFLAAVDTVPAAVVLVPLFEHFVELLEYFQLFLPFLVSLVALQLFLSCLFQYQCLTIKLILIIIF